MKITKNIFFWGGGEVKVNAAETDILTVDDTKFIFLRIDITAPTCRPKIISNDFCAGFVCFKQCCRDNISLSYCR